MTFFLVFSRFCGKLDLCESDDLSFWSLLDFAENWTSAEVMTFFLSSHLILRNIGRNMSFFSLFLANMSFFPANCLHF